MLHASAGPYSWPAPQIRLISARSVKIMAAATASAPRALPARISSLSTTEKNAIFRLRGFETTLFNRFVVGNFLHKPSPSEEKAGEAEFAVGASMTDYSRQQFDEDIRLFCLLFPKARELMNIFQDRFDVMNPPSSSSSSNSSTSLAYEENPAEASVTRFSNSGILTSSDSSPRRLLADSRSQPNESSESSE